MLERLSNYVYKIGYGCCVALFTVMLSSMLIQVFFRYVLNRPLLWPEEITRFSMVWLAFIGASNGMKKGSHVYFSIIVDSLSGPLRQYLELLGVIFMLLFASVCIGFGVRLVMESKGASPTVHVPYAWIKLSLIVGFSFVLIHTIHLSTSRFSRLFREMRNHISGENR